MREASTTADFRPLGIGLAWTGLSVFAGAAVAPWLFEALLRLGRARPALSGLRELEFPSVFSRCVLVAFCLGGLWLARRQGIRSWRELPVLQGEGRFREFLSGLRLGLVSLALLGGLGLLLGAYQWEGWSGKLPGLLIGALFVGLLEELLFRGLLYRAFRAFSGVGVAAFASSVIFALVHFARPKPPLGTVRVEWFSGFELLRHCFYTGHPPHHYLPYVLVLFLMGVLLCLLFEQRNLYLVAGMHAGWVMIMQAVNQLFLRNPEIAPQWFGPGGVIAKSWIAFALIAAWTAVAVLRLRGRKP